jgi:hypothetical protein
MTELTRQEGPGLEGTRQLAWSSLDRDDGVYFSYGPLHEEAPWSRK